MMIATKEGQMAEKKKSEIFDVAGEMEITARDMLSNRFGECVTHATEHYDIAARIAMGLVEKWGMVAGKPDGEDAAGRSKLALLDPDEVVDRAVVTAEGLVAKLRERGHIHKIPGLKEILGTDD